ncbi:hypothetical protein MTO96_033178 [Rhipicephalus appendiculatus]
MVSESDSCAFSVSDFGDAMSECGFDDVHASSASVGWISVFWDIENCAVPNGVPAYDIVRKVRQTFYKGLREADFLVACDIGRMKPAVVGELTEAHVTLMHVPGGQKNAADEKLRSELRRFSDAYKLTGSRVVLISGDVDFAAEIHEIRYKNLIHVALIHNDQAKRSLTDTANQSIRYAEFVADIRKDERPKEAKASAPTGQRKPLTEKPPQVGKVNNAQAPAGICKVAARSTPSGQKQAVKKLPKESQKDSVRVTWAIFHAEAGTAPVSAGGGANGICASNKKRQKQITSRQAKPFSPRLDFSFVNSLGICSTGRASFPN